MASNVILEQIKKDVDKAERNVKQLKKDREMYQVLIGQLNKKISDGEVELSELKKKLNTFATNSFVSDHATLRYLERLGLIDLSNLKKSILTEEVLNAIYVGADKVHSNGLEFRIKNGKIVTIINEDGIEE